MDCKEKCGLFGVYNSKTASQDIYLGLYRLQHRGQESAGMVVGNGKGKFHQYKNQGLVTNVFSRERIEKMKGAMGIGHVRYSTSGETNIANAQPIVVSYRKKPLALAHNGNLVNVKSLRDKLEFKGSIFTTTSDSEVILHRIVRAESRNTVDRIIEGLRGIKGAYSILLLFEHGICAVRDPRGFRPLFMGRKGKSIYFSSETCAFDLLKINDISEINAGEGIYVSDKKVKKFSISSFCEKRMYAFELIYFSRSDSIYKDSSIHHIRVKLGEELAKDKPVSADMVLNVPDFSNSAALGDSRKSGIPLDIAMIRSHYSGRTFIGTYQTIRDFKVRKKYNIINDVVKNKKIVIVDDSIVRGSTAKKIISMFREKEVKEIHLRI